MNQSKRRAAQAPTPSEQPPTAENAGRDAQGRFTAGNGGGPGNPFARRVAQLRAVLLETVTDEEMRIVAGQLMVKAKFGDLAAIKLLFQYVLGKPAATVNPDALDVEEVDLYRRAPEHETMQEVLKQRVPAELAVDMLRLALPFLAQKLENAALGADPDTESVEEECDQLAAGDLDDEEEEDPEDESGPVGAAPSPNGGMHDDPRPRATRPSPNGGPASAKPQARPTLYGDNRRRSPDARGPDRRPPCGT
jgi:hypothetical protein